MAADDGWEALTRVEGSVLLCLLSVGCERLGQRMSGGGRVSLRRVVDLCDAIVSFLDRCIAVDVTYWRGRCACPGSGSRAGGPAGVLWLRALWGGGSGGICAIWVQ